MKKIGEKTYIYALYYVNIMDTKSNNKVVQYYVVVEEQLSNEDKELLKNIVNVHIVINLGIILLNILHLDVVLDVYILIFLNNVLLIMHVRK